jgi:hypothetical protein
MGLESEDPVYIPNTDAQRILGEAYPGYGNPGYATNQFYGLNNVEPFGITRQNHDNPRFLWPQKEHMDQSGRTYTIQRGYMRSLLTDPNVSQNSSVPNRRVFFQFNPLVLQREVQQSVGTMMPLLQDPAQLVQPVPGTTQFSFQLMFNREHEVNKGSNEADQEWLKLPTGQRALVSEIGVLADLMMLDSITGQGLSEDMISALVANTKRQYQNYNTIVTNAKEQDKEKGIDVDENAEDYRTVDLPKTDTEMNEIFNANIGNSAFLNPLPFRVMFSSLFMVEGVATSVSVSFNKFSKTMVPTQCLVTINMYALYLGFAKKKTFIYDNLIQAAEDAAESASSLDEQQPIMDQAVVSVKAWGYTNQNANDNNIGRWHRFQISDLKIDERLKQQKETERLKDIKYSFSIEYKFTNTADGLDLPKNCEREVLVQVGENGKGSKGEHGFGTKNVLELLTPNNIFEEKRGKDADGYPYATNNDDENDKDQTYFQYITFRIIVKVTAMGATGSLISSQDIVLTTAKNWKWYETNPGNSTKTEYVRGITSAPGTTANQGGR